MGELEAEVQQALTTSEHTDGDIEHGSINNQAQETYSSVLHNENQES